MGGEGVGVSVSVGEGWGGAEVGGRSTVGQEINFYNSRHLPYQIDFLVQRQRESVRVEDIPPQITGTYFCFVAAHVSLLQNRRGK